MSRGTKVITVCGSLRFKEEMIRVGVNMEIAGNVVLLPIIPAGDKDDFTEEELAMLGKMHKEKIKLSDAILVVDVDGYIGEATRGEILFAETQNKEIMYYSKMKFDK